jgi:hypothetical protein
VLICQLYDVGKAVKAAGGVTFAQSDAAYGTCRARTLKPHVDYLLPRLERHCWRWQKSLGPGNAFGLTPKIGSRSSAQALRLQLNTAEG